MSKVSLHFAGLKTGLLLAIPGVMVRSLSCWRAWVVCRRWWFSGWGGNSGLSVAWEIGSSKLFRAESYKNKNHQKPKTLKSSCLGFRLEFAFSEVLKLKHKNKAWPSTGCCSWPILFQLALQARSSGDAEDFNEAPRRACRWRPYESR